MWTFCDVIFTVLIGVSIALGVFGYLWIFLLKK